MDKILCWTFRETAEALRIGDKKLRHLIECEGLPVIPSLGEEHHIFVPALEQWLWQRVRSGGASWQEDGNTSTGQVPFTGARMDSGKRDSRILSGQASGNRSTGRRGGRQ